MNLEALKVKLVDGILDAIRGMPIGELVAERPLQLIQLPKKTRKRWKSRPSSHYPTPAQAKRIVDVVSAKLTGSKKTGFTLKTSKRDFHHYRKDRLVRRAKDLKLRVTDLTVP